MLSDALKKAPPLVLPKLRKWAGTQVCSIRLGGICVVNGTVWAHHPHGCDKGEGIKGCDLMGAVACTPCHDQIDSRGGSRLAPVYTIDDLLLAFLRGHDLSIVAAIRDGIITVT